MSRGLGDVYKRQYQLMPDEILEVVEPVIKLTANTYDGANELLETECKFWIKSEKETFGRNIYSAPGEGHWYEYYRQEDVPWGKKRNGSAEYTMLRSPYYNTSYYFCFVYAYGNANFNNARTSFGVAPAFSF